jgi:hypothetical protein
MRTTDEIVNEMHHVLNQDIEWDDPEGEKKLSAALGRYRELWLELVEVEKNLQKGRYYTIALYDSFDNDWVTDCDEHFTDLESAKKRCLEMMEKLGVGNKSRGEHYSVFEWTDEKVKEVFRPVLGR